MKTKTKARELQSYLRSLNGGWMDEKKTVDTFKAGDPDAEVQGIAVGWMSYTWALWQAIDLGCNVFVTHEPTYYDHYDNNAEMFCLQSVQDKRHFIKENGLIILRCHDLWDQVPGIGIPDSWAQLLGFGEPIDGTGYFRVYDVSGRTAGDVARQIAAHTGSLGQEAVQLIGSLGKPVTRACIGTGAITPFLTFVHEYDADLAICSDDGISYWRDGAYAIDMDIPLIVVNHAVTEEAGMANLANHLQSQFPHVPVHHISQGCMYRLVAAP